MVGEFTQGGRKARRGPAPSQPEAAKRGTLLLGGPGGRTGKVRHRHLTSAAGPRVRDRAQRHDVRPAPGRSAHPAPSTLAGSPRRPDPRYGRPRACLSGLLPALALLLGALSPFAAAPAAAEVLVSNIGQTVSSSVNDLTVNSNAQGFTTGSFSGGYVLAGIDVRVRLGSPAAAAAIANLRAEVWSSTSAGAPDSKLFDLTPPASIGSLSRVAAYTAPLNTVLASDTTYHLVLYRTDNLETLLHLTASTDEDAGGETGWSIADFRHTVSNVPPSGTWSKVTTRLGLIRVKGSRVGAVTPPAAPAGLSVVSTSGFDNLSLSWTAPAGTVTRYEVHYTSADASTAASDAAASGTDASAAWVAIARGNETDPPAASQTIPDLTGGTAYRVRVRAINGGIPGAWAFGRGVPQSLPTDDPWTGALTVKDLTGSINNGCNNAVSAAAQKCSTAATLSPGNTFTVGGTSYTIAEITNRGSSGGRFYFNLSDATTPNAALRALNVCVGTTAFALSGLIHSANLWTLEARGPGFVWAIGETVPLRVAASCLPTTPATGTGPQQGPVLDGLTLHDDEGNPVTLKRKGSGGGDGFDVTETIYLAVVPYDTTQVSVVPTWSATGTVATAWSESRDAPYAGAPWRRITEKRSIESGNSLNVDLASDHPSTNAVVHLFRRASHWTSYEIEVRRRGPFGVSLSATPNPVEEGKSAKVTATLEAPWDGDNDLRIPLTVTTGTAEDEDWLAQPNLDTNPNIYFSKQRTPQAEILIRRGERTGTIGIRARPDDDSDDETLTVALGTLPGCVRMRSVYPPLQSCVTAGEPTSVTITITEPTGGGGTEAPTVTLTAQLYALIQQVEGWRDDPRHSANREHVARWNRVLLAFGWTVKPASDSSLTRMSAAEAQGYADRGWTRWVPVAAALRDIEGPPPPPPPEPDPVVTIAGGAAVTEGAAADFTLTSAPAPSADLAVEVSVSQSGAYAQASVLGARTVTIPAGTASASFTVATVDDSTDEADGGIVATLAAGSGYTLGDAARASVKVADNDEDNPDIVTRRSTAREGSDDAVVFRVRLNRAAAHTVTVNYATADGARAWAGTPPATAGSDYTASSGTLTFAAGETQKTVSVPILDDAIDEGMEHFLLRFSNPQGAALPARYRETQGLIMNDDHLQAMWLSRFGRTVGSQVTDAVSERLAGGLTPGAHATLAGQGVDLTKTDDGRALADVLTGLAQTFGAPSDPAAGEDGLLARHGLNDPWNGPGTATTARSITGRELLLGSSFHVAGTGEGSGPGLAAWGRVAHGSFDGEHADGTGRTTVDGEVVTGVLGADAAWNRLLAGVAISLSEGDGSFDSAGADVGARGSIASTMTTVSPYARFEVTERVSAWGLAGWGTGDMTIRFDDGSMAPVRTDLSMRLGAIGARGALLTQDGAGGMDLALKADAFFVRTESEKAANSAETTANASRVRLVLEGGRAFVVGNGATFRPSLELGVRHDGGDAETGAGVEIGGGVSYADADSGLSVDVRARMLAAHADADYREWGASAMARLDPGERGRGLSLSLSPTIGATSSASERLWGAHDARALTPGGEFEASRGLRGEMGYGMALLGDRFTGTPNLGFGMSDGGAREYRLGWRLTSAVEGDPGFEVNLDATRREGANDNGAPDHGVMLRSLIRW